MRIFTKRFGYGSTAEFEELPKDERVLAIRHLRKAGDRSVR